jgi:tetratricopeptide (TPR) repeat protein
VTSTARPTTACPDPEMLAAFSEGMLSRDESAALIAHIDGCEDCMTALEVLNETIATRPAAPFASRRPFARRRAWWLAVAAALAIGVLALAVLRDRIGAPSSGRSSMAHLIDLAPRSVRPVEARLSGGFPWAAYRGPMRAEDADADPERLKLMGAAGEIVAAADRDRSANAQQAAGVALVVIDKPVPAIERLRAAVQASPGSATAWNDLAAAQYSAALRLVRLSLLPEALDSVDRALRLDPRMAEARFNRALVLERLGLAQQAYAEWKHYLEIDSASKWAIEAREHLARVKPPAASRLLRDLPALESVAEQGDARTLAALIDSDPQYTRAVAEAEILGRWAEAAKRGDDAGGQRELRAARAIGDALVRRSGETLLSETVRAIDAAPPSARATLADAHVVYRRGRIAYSGRQLDAALADLARAAALFESARSPMALVARYYAASVRFDQSDVAAAREGLQKLLGEARTRPGFVALGAQVRWELALTLMVDGDWSAALPLLEDARASFRRLDERNHLGFIESLLADTLLSVGRPDDAWAARIRAFALLSADGNGDRLPVSLKAAAQMEMRRGRLATARALLDAARATGLQIASDAIGADVLIHSALVNVALGDGEEAGRGLREAAAAANRISDPTARELARTHLELAGAAILLRSDAPRAKEMLTRAIDGYRASGRIVFLPECYLLRARATLREDRAGADAEAARVASADADLEQGIEALEHSRIRTGSVVGTGVHDAGNALFEDAIRLHADRGELDRAFIYVERSRAQLFSDPRALPSSVRELRERLGASDTAVLQIVVLPEELVALCVTAGGAAMERHPIARDAVETLAARSASAEEDTRSLAELYDLIIRPFEALLTNSRQLIIVSDRSLQIVPFAALYDSAARRYLVERIAVSTALSASSLRPIPQGRTGGSLLTVALSSGESSAGLPESTAEVAAIASLYPSAVTLASERATFAAFADAAAGADVIHVAGHTARQSDDDGTALVFGRERVTWSAIANRRLPRAPIVVLAACETLQQHAPAYVRTLTLGGGFLAAGATDVVGTLTPIADADARDLFESIHRHLAAGAVPAEAVRAAQIEALAHHSGAWRAVASLTRSIHINVTRS